MLALFSISCFGFSLGCLILSLFMGLNSLQDMLPFLFGLLAFVHLFSCIRQFDFMDDGNATFWTKVFEHQPNPTSARKMLRLIMLATLSLWIVTIGAFIARVALAAVTGTGAFDVGPVMEAAFTALPFSVISIFFYLNSLIHIAYVRKNGGVL